MTVKAAVTVAALALLAGCGSSSSSTPSSRPSSLSSSSGGSSASSSGGASAPPHACKVLTARIASKQLGSPAKRTRKAKPNPSETQCVYTSQGGGSISLLVGDWNVVQPLPNTADGKKLTGVGDEALLTPTALIVRKGNAGIEVTAFKASGTFGGSAAKNEQKQSARLERKIALDLLPRL